MVAVALWFVVALALLSTVLASTAATLARAAVHTDAERAAGAAVRTAVGAYEDALARGQSLPGEMSATLAPLPGEDAARMYTAAYVATPTTLAPPSCVGGAAGGPDAVTRLQCSPLVAESRVSLHVAVRVLAGDGAAELLHRDAYATLRVIGDPPSSAVLTGLTDAAALDGVPSPAPHEGDLGGAAPATTIHVTYGCVDGTGRCANGAPPDPDAVRDAVPWSNGNRPAP